MASIVIDSDSSTLTFVTGSAYGGSYRVVYSAILK